jgi:dipeptidyl aminopeptidase/acylaminoacyl peptidase
VEDPYRLGEIVRDSRQALRFQRLMNPAGLIAGGTITPNWMSDGASFRYATGAPHDPVMMRVDGVTGAVTPLAPIAENDALPERETLRSYRRPMWLSEPVLVTEAPSPDKAWFASIQHANVVLRAGHDDSVVVLTTDGTPELAWDIEAPRFRVTPGVGVERHLLDPWSPEGSRLFAIKVDRRAVPDLSFVRYLEREEEVCTQKTQRAGGPLDVAHPHIIDVRSKRLHRLELGDTTDQYFTLVGWLPDGSEVLFTRHARDFKRVDLLAANPHDGSVRVVMSETAATFVALQHEVIFGGNNHATLLPKGSALIWRSSRSGWNHLYLYSIRDGMVRALTHGEFAVIDVIAMDPEAEWVYFTAHHDERRPYDTHLCRVRLRGGRIERLTELDGQNIVRISPARRTFLVVNSRPDRPFRTDFHACDGRRLATVQHADVSGLAALGKVASEEFTVRAADGTTLLWGVMHKPADFDPTRRYPIIDHIYGGPQVAFVARDFGLGEHSLSRLDRALAQLGYIVISLDARGTPERSKAFQDVVYRNWGRHEIADHAGAIEQLAQRHSFIDRERVGIWGHSWGGYFTIRALAQAPELFRVGVAAAPGSGIYDSILYEPFLDLPSRARDAYEYADNRAWLHKITGKLMMIVGTSDARIYNNAMRTLHHLIEAGVDHELVVLPGAGHVFEGKHEEYFIHKLVKHFELHLRPARDVAASLGATRNARRRERVAANT